MYVLNQTIFKHAMENAGYRSAKELAQKLNIHRNTIGAYIQGKAVLPDAFEQIIRALKLCPADALIEIKEEDSSAVISKIMPLVEALVGKSNDYSVFLFGSRSKNAAAKYSDFDLGVYSSSGMSYKDFRELIKIKEEHEDNLPYFVDIINLNSVDHKFLTGIVDDLILLSGTYADLLKLKSLVSNNGRIIKK